MKKLIAIVILCIAGIALGVTTITYNIPDVFGAKLLTALKAQADAHIRIGIRGSQNSIDPNEEDYSTFIDFRTPPHDPNVTNVVFVKKTIALYASALEKAHEKWLKIEARKLYDAGSPSIDVNEPDPNEMN